MPQWEVVGGADKGGILVREGEGLKSPATSERLSTGAIVDELKLVGERLNYKLVTGTGPAEGWVSLKVSGKELLIPKVAPLDAASWPGLLKDTLSAAGAAGTVKEAAPWFRPIGKAPATAKARLVIFNWTGNRGGAGSAHALQPIPKALNTLCGADTWQVCEVAYTGRGTRMKDPHITDYKMLVSAVADSVGKAGAPLPTLFFGFSFGGILAYETAALLVEKSFPVLGVVVASAEHPGWEGRKTGVGKDGGPTKDVKDPAFRKVLHEKGGTEVILQSEDMAKMFVPVIFSDMVMEEGYGAAPPSHDPLPCPIVVFRGEKDPLIARADVDPWLELTACKEGTPTRIEELATDLKPTDGSPWLNDWYLLQGEPSFGAILKAIAKDFGGAS